MSGDDTVRPAAPGYRWQSVDVLAYKQDGAAPFRDITRQVLFDDPGMAAELRYFEMAAGGHSTLERHEHRHAVVIYRGRGQCLVGGVVRDVAMGDLIAIRPMDWHQFRANRGEPLGFLCMVDRQRDKPQLPNDAERAQLLRNCDVAAFLES